MKTATYYRSSKVIPYRRPKTPAYPNAAARRHRVDKAVDYALTAVTSVGFAAALLFLLTLL